MSLGVVDTDSDGGWSEVAAAASDSDGGWSEIVAVDVLDDAAGVPASVASDSDGGWSEVAAPGVGPPGELVDHVPDAVVVERHANSVLRRGRPPKPQPRPAALDAVLVDDAPAVSCISIRPLSSLAVSDGLNDDERKQVKRFVECTIARETCKM